MWFAGLMSASSTTRRPHTSSDVYVNSVGTQAQFTEGGALTRLEADGLSVLQYPASELEDGLARLVVRRRDVLDEPIVSHFGQNAIGRVRWTPDGPVVSAGTADLAIVATFRLAADRAAWFWHCRVTNRSSRPLVVDVLHTQDIALAPRAAVRTSEYYVSQYLDVTPLAVPAHGTALAVRQNMPGDRAPWALVGALDVADLWCSDALQLERAGGLGGDLPGTRLQHEHTMVGLQTPGYALEPGETMTTGFYGLVLPDHQAATTPEDVRHAEQVLTDPGALHEVPDASPAHADSVAGRGRSLFTTAAPLSALTIEDERLRTLVGTASAWTDVERDGDELLSASTGHDGHVVTAAKQAVVLRPHGHILRTGSAWTPDERSVTTTAWMDGGFHTQVTQGHVALGSVLSLRRSYLGLFQAHGLRLFVAPEATPDDWRLLGRPSAWWVSPGGCRWWYRTEDGLIEVASSAATDRHELTLDARVLDGPPLRWRAALHVALGGDDGADRDPPGLSVDHRGLTLSPPAGSLREQTYPGGTVRLGWSPGSDPDVARDEALFTDGRSRDLPWVVLTTQPRASWSMSLTPRLVADAAGPDAPAPGSDPVSVWSDVAQRVRLTLPAAGDPDDDPAGDPDDELRRLDAVLPWFAHDALVHFLSPRGLEQYTGGGWGTRDVSQGPVGVLLAVDEPEALRDVAARLLRAQNARGDWPQSFDFYARHRQWYQGDSHGDVVYWPLLALGDHLLATADATFLRHVERFVATGGPTAPAPLLDHLDRALDAIESARIPGTRLPAYGHGDWNDSLQPADPALAAALCSTWTVVLQAQALSRLAGALEALEAPADLSDRAATVAGRARRIADEGVVALREELLVDGVLAGYGRVADGRVVELLIHPGDERTGLTYSLLPMIHAVTAGILTPDEARHHLGLIRDHLSGPDGARLFDRPAAYHGGPMEVFQRAEASTFFGREIGIMYTHAHLRYAEALARVGDADGLLAALAQANPMGMTERVPSARARQATTYYSSSDAVFRDRYEAAEDYAGVRDGTVPLEGGWRVYSSGPGLFLRLVVENLLGIRRLGAVVEIDPVLPASADGLIASVRLFGRPVEVRFRVGPTGSGPTSVTVDGTRLEAYRLENPYRTGGLAVHSEDLHRLLAAGANRIDVEVP
jgi:CRISPR-associated protein Csx3